MSDEDLSVEELGLGSYRGHIDGRLGGPVERLEAYEDQRETDRSRDAKVAMGQALGVTAGIGGAMGAAHSLLEGNTELAKLSGVASLTGLWAASAAGLMSPKTYHVSETGVSNDYEFVRDDGSVAEEFLDSAETVMYEDEVEGWQEADETELEQLYDAIIEDAGTAVSAIHIDERDDGYDAFELHAATGEGVYRFAGEAEDLRLPAGDLSGPEPDISDYRRRVGT